MKWNRVIVGDCIEVMKKFPDDSVDLTVFSPPYDDARSFDTEWSMDLSKVGKLLYDKTVDGGMCAMVIGDTIKDYARTLSSFETTVDWCRNAGWKLFETIIYYKNGRPGMWFNVRFRVDHEYIMLFLKGDKPRHFDKSSLMIPTKNPGKSMKSSTTRKTDGSLKKVHHGGSIKSVKCRGTVWFYHNNQEKNNELKRKHPAVYPDSLAKDLIACFSKENDRVLDPMCGSGTTCVMAAKMNRRYIGIDISDNYVKIAKKRIKNEASIEEMMYRKSGSKWSVSPLDGE